MKCKQEEQCLLYLWGEMAPNDSKAFAQHLEKCPACKEQVARHEPLVRSMQSIEPEELPVELSQRISRRIETRLTQAFEAKSAGLWFTPRRVLAVAASIMLFIGLGVLWKVVTNARPDSANGDAKVEEIVLTEDDYVEALALVWISEPEQTNRTPPDSEDILATEIQNVAAQIESLLQEVEYKPVQDKSGTPPDDVQGSRPPTTRRALVS